jgi:hypothetical protein
MLFQTVQVQKGLVNRIDFQGGYPLGQAIHDPGTHGSIEGIIAGKYGGIIGLQ